MSMTIYGGMTKNWIEVEGMVDNGNDIVYFSKEYEGMFIRFSQCNVNENVKPCLVIFHNDDPFVPIYAKVVDKWYDPYKEDVSSVLDDCWEEAKAFGIPLKKSERKWEQCKEELISYAKENNVDLCIEESPLSFEILVDKYAEFKNVYEGYTKEDLMKDAIEEWNMEQEADLV